MEKKTRIYMDIQSLLDLRQSVLVEMMGEEKGTEYVNSEAYYLRDVDEFPVDMAEFERLMGDYNVALKRATITYMEVMLRSKAANMEKLNAFNGVSAPTELVLNIYPYLIPEKLAESLRDGLFTKLGIPIFVSVVHEPIETFTPIYLKQNGFVEFYCYDSSSWLTAHLDAVSKVHLRETRLNFPTLGKHALPDKDRKEIKKLGFDDVYRYTEFILSAAVSVNFIPVGLYGNIFVGTALLERVARAEQAKPMATKENIDVHLEQQDKVP